MSEEIRLTKEEMYAPEVTRAIERERRLQGRRPPEPAPVSPLRRLVMSPAFHLPVAGLLAALTAWAIVEPHFDDTAMIGGEVVLVNKAPFAMEIEDAIVLTVGAKEVVAIPGQTRLEPGADGQPAFATIEDVENGTVVEASGADVGDGRLLAVGIRPATRERAAATGQDVGGDVLANLLFFPVTAVLIAFALLLMEGVASRNWVRMAERMMLGLLLTLVFSVLGYIPAGVAMLLGQVALQLAPGEIATVHTLPAVALMLFAAGRSVAWASIGAATGLGMNMARSTKAQLRNTVVGGALGGALGGLFFDPIGRFFTSDSAFAGADVSRLVGLAAVGLSIGFFVALVERLAREAWLRVRTGPLAGKQFILYRTPTTIGSAPQADVYLFKDAEIEPTHAKIHRVGNRYEVEDMDSRHGTQVGGRPIRRHRLTSGDTIVLGATVLEFEERAKRS
jgi:hypothetical protein